MNVVSGISKSVPVETKSAEPIKQNDLIFGGETTIEPPLSNYSEIKGEPYTADYLNIFFWKSLSPQLDVNGIRDSVGNIENFVMQEIKDRQLDNTLASYREVMDKIKKSLNISDNEVVESKINKINAYIRMANKHKEFKAKDNYFTNLAKKLKIQFKAGELT